MKTLKTLASATVIGAAIVIGGYVAVYTLLYILMRFLFGMV